jgi:hypothetical protein
MFLLRWFRVFNAQAGCTLLLKLTCFEFEFRSAGVALFQVCFQPIQFAILNSDQSSSKFELPSLEVIDPDSRGTNATTLIRATRCICLVVWRHPGDTRVRFQAVRPTPSQFVTTMVQVKCLGETQQLFKAVTVN